MNNDIFVQEMIVDELAQAENRHNLALMRFAVMGAPEHALIKKNERIERYERLSGILIE